MPGHQFRFLLRSPRGNQPLQRRVASVAGQHELQVPQLLTTEYLAKTTKFATYAELLERAGLAAESLPDPIDPQSIAARDLLVARETNFANFDALLKDAATEWAVSLLKGKTTLPATTSVPRGSSRDVIPIRALTDDDPLRRVDLTNPPGTQRQLDEQMRWRQVLEPLTKQHHRKPSSPPEETAPVPSGLSAEEKWDLALDAAALFDPTGAIVDTLHALDYARRGRYFDAAVTGLAAVPFGDLLKPIRYLRQAPLGVIDDAAARFSKQTDDLASTRVTTHDSTKPWSGTTQSETISTDLTPEVVVVTPTQPILGGKHREVRAANKGGHVHHMPANSVTRESSSDGLSILMEEADHMKTGSWGRLRSAVEYRRKQAELIAASKQAEALQMDIDDLQDRFGTKYYWHVEQLLHRRDSLE